VKLLFDQNLSPRLVEQLADVFAGSLHVRQAGLDRANDDAIWRFARDNGYAIVTKDSDFQERSQMAASAPRIVWVRRGNCSTQDIETMLRKHALQIAALEQQTDTNFVVLL
jgi:predicted nuclease of predicted toxin-antitoxin system